MDVVDRKILAALQEDGRLTITELAAQVGLRTVNTELTSARLRWAGLSAWELDCHGRVGLRIAG